MRRPRIATRVAEPDDELLLAKIATGSADALGELYDRYGDQAYRVARSVCRDDARAEDAVQEAFISIWKSGATFRPYRGTVAAWVLTLVRYRAIDVARSHGATAARRVGDSWMDERPAPDDVAAHVIAREHATRLHGLLDRLPDAQREVITLAFYGQLSHSEIAAQLGVPTGTVKGRMRLGLEKLRAGIAQPHA